ncbi:MAG: hypothetical protein ACO3JL_20955, partial [Myxococcota bacterium]
MRSGDALHPLAVEALVRAPSAALLGAAISRLPTFELHGASWLRRVFLPGNQRRQAWLERLRSSGSQGTPLELLVAAPGAEHGPGGLVRLACALGVVAQRVLEEALLPLDTGAGAETKRRALATDLWAEAPGRDAAVRALSPESHGRLVAHLHAALTKAYGEAPGGDVLDRWVRGFHVALESGFTVTSAALTGAEQVSLAETLASATAAFVRRANPLAATFLGEEPPPATLLALATQSEEHFAEGPAEARAKVIALRREHLGRGRNESPAFHGADADVAALLHGVATLAPAYGEPLHGYPPIVAEGTGVAPAPPTVPVHTQELSVLEVNAQLGRGAEDDDTATVPTTLPPAAPTSTQQVSLSDVEEVLAALETPPTAPTSTQQVSLSDVEEVLAAQGTPPAVPTSTQQVS